MGEMNNPIAATADDERRLRKIANMKMPFGKYKGVPLIDLPEPYVVWFASKGFPSGELGILMQTLYEIKLNGLEHLILPLKEDDSAAPASRAPSRSF